MFILISILFITSTDGTHSGRGESTSIWLHRGLDGFRRTCNKKHVSISVILIFREGPLLPVHCKNTSRVFRTIWSELQIMYISSFKDLLTSTLMITAMQELHSGWLGVLISRDSQIRTHTCTSTIFWPLH